MNHIQKNKNTLPIIFSFLFVCFMIIICLWILKPFIIGFTWASMIVIATWPLLLKIQNILWGKRSLAVLFMMSLLILVFIIPIILLINSLIANSGLLIAWLSSHPLKMPELIWLKAVPIIGYKSYSYYNYLINSSGVALLSQIQPYIVHTTSFVFTQAEHFGLLMIHLGIMLIYSVLLYLNGEKMGSYVRNFAFKLADNEGEKIVLLAMQAIRAVALGVVVTACVQGVLGGIGLSISGIPFSTFLTVLMIISCLAQIGPLIILIPAIIWLYWIGDHHWGTILLIWSCIICALETLLRSVLIRQGADLPIILICTGVIGGLFSFGMLGLFIGPVVLAISYQFILSWIQSTPTLDYPLLNKAENSQKK
ncbi:AI-2E family transporter YdiK [Candidatus Erwinia haradaeae]|uniref:Transport protein YdiK n=1 Tax=Candidatus Erwinia haradaeae TaxID=1922217 RepID=A0A451D2L2_9GAMM|nr:AI-2E family transporter YdiK [Candidatus Erwinia haradaeae]VFP79875.1 Putative transport protein YdiK [Candidatus Erwinia haradaeae]